MTTIRGALGALTLAAMAAIPGGEARAQAPAPAPAQPDTIWACYVPTSGTMYRIKVADTKDGCVGNGIAFSWNAKGIKGDKGDKGDTGPQGPAGPPGSGGGSGFTLPYTATVSSAGPLLNLTNSDGGGVGQFSSGGSQNTLNVSYTGTSSVNAVNATSSSGVAALRAANTGTGVALRAENSSTSNTNNVINVFHAGAGQGLSVQSVSGPGAFIQAGTRGLGIQAGTGNGIDVNTSGNFGINVNVTNANGNSAIWAKSDARFATIDARATSATGTAYYGEAANNSAAGFKVTGGNDGTQAVWVRNEGPGMGLGVVSMGVNSTAFFHNDGTGQAANFVSANQYNTVYVENKGAGSAAGFRNDGDGGTISAVNTGANGGAGNFTSAGQWATLSANNSNTANGIAFYAEGHGTGHTATIRNLATGGALNLESSATTASTLNINHTGGGGGVGALWATSSAQNTAWFVNTGTGNNIALGARGSGVWPVAQFEHTAGAGHVALRTFGDADVNGNITVHGDQQVMGAKNAIVPTSTGMTKVYSEESTELWFTDYGEARLVNGVARIPIDPHFSETVDLGVAYHVFVQANDDATLYVAKRTPAGFEVRARDGDAGATFSYRLVAKRKGYAGERLAPAK